MNRSGKPILALDLPSGLDADTGQPLGAAVRRRATATFVAPKLGFAAPGPTPTRARSRHRHRRPAQAPGAVRGASVAGTDRRSAIGGTASLFRRGGATEGCLGDPRGFVGGKPTVLALSPL